MNIRPLTTLSEFQECMELQRQGFGWTDLDLMPVRSFVVANYIGGLVLGAFDESDRLAGFLSAIPGARPGMNYWHSHMLAVTPARRDAGIGSRLKLAQRQYAIQRGISLIEWTFDPLESRNAYFNIEKLGVIVRRYHPNFYGTAVPSGIDSDRLVAEWWIDRARVLPAGEQRRLDIPADIQSIRKADSAAARDIQRRVCQVFLQNAAEDFFVVAFERHSAGGNYVFVRGASGVYQTR